MAHCNPYSIAVAEIINGLLKQEFLLEQYNYPLDVMKVIIKTLSQFTTNNVRITLVAI